MLTTLEQHRSKISENIGILRRTLDTFPRVRLGHLPTPLEPMDRLSDELNGPRFWVKRDDCTGLSSGVIRRGNLSF